MAAPQLTSTPLLPAPFPAFGATVPSTSSAPSSSTTPSSSIMLPSPGTMPQSVGTMPQSVGTMPPSVGTMPPSVGTMPPSVGTMPPSVDVSMFTPWADWQGALRDRAARPVSDVVLLGSHDAAAYGSLDMQPPFLAQQDHAAALPFLWALRGTINDLSVTQSVDLHTQALLGVRMFDLRVSRATDGEFYFWHGFRTRETLGAGLMALATFLTQHPSEYLMLFLRVDGRPTPAEVEEVWRTVLSMLGPRLVRFPSDARYNTSIAGAAGRVFMWANREAHMYDDRFGDYTVLVGAWQNRWKPSELAQRVTDELLHAESKSVHPHTFYALPFTITPGRNEFVANFFLRWLWPPAAPSIRRQARILNTQYLTTLLRDHGDAVRDRCWAICIDFVTEVDSVYAWLLKANDKHRDALYV